MGFLQKIGLVEDTAPVEPAPVEDISLDQEVEVSVCDSFDYPAEDIVSIIRQKLQEAGIALDSLEKFRNYTATLPDTMGDDAKAKTMSSILAVSSVSMVSVSEDIDTYDSTLQSTGADVEATINGVIEEATNEIAEHKKAIENLQKKIENSQTYRLTAIAAIEAERKALADTSAFALLVSGAQGETK